MVNARQSAKMERQSQERARAYLRLIMQVQAGEMTVSGAARQLGVSRQVFHEHCNRMLAASLEALDGGRGGRPAQSAEQLQIREMEQQLAEKTKELSNLKILYNLRGEVLTLFRDGSSPAGTGKKKRKPGWNPIRSTRQPSWSWYGRPRTGSPKSAWATSSGLS